ncbi:zona pellucida sperm-binding protein 3-like [Clupea harengus]|uniref:Zona pellucida sperm-binding protein 3 n=1 Tax=Clupea harengus TaxID=7950 RepID=A0A6P8GP94_CLUHA|nr:zona pellucida sperm-binding protein 3-like [Clupea harengus]
MEHVLLGQIVCPPRWCCPLVYKTVEANLKRQTASGEPLTPTWLPMTHTIQAAGLLNFSLKVMEVGWRSVRSTTVFLQGEPVFLEAAVYAPLHPPLRVYVDYCVATLNPEPLSEPRYEFIVNQGCLVDSLVPLSSSQFAPRPRENSLRFSVQAFHFTRDPQDQDPQDQVSQQEQVFINCHLRAVPQLVSPDNLNKGCSFHWGSFSWRSVDGDHAVCSCCAAGDCHSHRKDTTGTTGTAKTPTALPTTEEKTNTAVGPLHFMPLTQWKGDFSLIGEPASVQ